MDAFNALTALVAPLDMANVDTDQIIPKQYLKSIKREGFGPNLFDDWRYLEPGEPGMDHSMRELNPDFVLNQKQYQGAKILLARDNFGCGSSREHAPWALLDYGFKCVIAPSFADIFYNNCFKNGLLPVVLTAKEVEHLFNQVIQQPGYNLSVDLQQQTVISDSGDQFEFVIDEMKKHRILNGLDDIAITLQNSEEIKRYESVRRESSPWLFGGQDDA